MTTSSFLYSNNLEGTFTVNGNRFGKYSRQKLKMSITIATPRSLIYFFSETLLEFLSDLLNEYTVKWGNWNREFK